MILGQNLIFFSAILLSFFAVILRGFDLLFSRMDKTIIKIKKIT